MKKMIALILLLVTLTTSDLALTLGGALGGWKHSAEPAVTEDMQAIFDKGLDGLVGVSYTPVAYLGSQVVAGTNYCFLAQATVVYPGAEPSYKLVYLYQNPEGEVSVLHIADLDLGALCEYGVD